MVDTYSYDAVGIAILLGLFFLMVILRFPITFALALSSIVTAITRGIGLEAIVTYFANGTMNFALLAIPFFIIMGEVMNEGGISQRIVAFGNLLVGWLPGGLALVNVMASMFYGGISGSAVADVSSLGSIEIPMMRKAGYDDEFSVGITVCSACQGVIIPPSHNMIIFAFSIATASQLAGGSMLTVSVGKLFLGGYIPGILLGINLMVIAFILSLIRKYPRGQFYSLREGAKIAVDAILALLTAVIVVGGVVTGIFTATESAAFAVLYAMFVTFVIYRQIPFKRMIKIMYTSLKTLGVVMSLIAAAAAFGFLLTFFHVPQLATNTLLSITTNKYLLLFLINIMLLILGCIMDMAPLILICTPILYPVLCLPRMVDGVVQAAFLDPVHFGVLLILNLAIGLCTPPVGSALFVGAAVGKITLMRAARGSLPFYISMLATLFLITYIPEITMFLPNLLMPK
ncbi:MAG: TRAP transporter large permease [Spirochaetales bacterium]|nr:TRAP transporter large permease [Spirochaetales bacterium]